MLVVAGLSDWLFASCALFAVTGIAVEAYGWFLPQFTFWGPLGATSAGLLLFRLAYLIIPALVALVLFHNH